MFNGDDFIAFYNACFSFFPVTLVAVRLEVIFGEKGPLPRPRRSGHFSLGLPRKFLITVSFNPAISHECREKNPKKGILMIGLICIDKEIVLIGNSSMT